MEKEVIFRMFKDGFKTASIFILFVVACVGFLCLLGYFIWFRWLCLCILIGILIFGLLQNWYEETKKKINKEKFEAERTCRHGNLLTRGCDSCQREATINRQALDLLQNNLTLKIHNNTEYKDVK